MTGYYNFWNFQPSLSTFSLVAAIDPALGPDIEKDVLEETVIIMAQECQLVGSNFDAMDEDTSVERVSAAIFKDPNFIVSLYALTWWKRIYFDLGLRHNAYNFKLFTAEIYTNSLFCIVLSGSGMKVK